MVFSKDDPLYYKDKINKLLKQAEENNINIMLTRIQLRPVLYFESKCNGDTVHVDLNRFAK